MQPFVPYNQGPTVSLLSSFILVKYICHTHTAMHAYTHLCCIIRSLWLNNKRYLQWKLTKKEFTEKFWHVNWRFENMPKYHILAIFIGQFLLWVCIYLCKYFSNKDKNYITMIAIQKANLIFISVISVVYIAYDIAI